MNMMRKFDDILNECVERVLKGESVEACLKAFPQHAAELEPLLRTAADAKKAAYILPRPEFRQQAAYEFQSAVRNLKPQKQGILKWQVRLVTTLSIIVIILMAGTGTIAASANSLPDQPLYGVKLFTENVQVALTPSAVGKAELYNRLTDTRVEEIIKMADKGKVEQVVKTTELLNDHLNAIAELIQPAGDTTASGEGEPQDLSSALSANVTAAPAPETEPSVSAATLTPVTITAPAIALKPTLSPTTTPDFDLVPVPVPTSKPAPVKTPNTTVKAPSVTVKTTPVPTTHVRSVTSSNTTLAVTSNVSKPVTNIKVTVSNQTAKNTQDLQDAFNRAPDSMKPALERAIDVAGRGYNEGLKHK
jgi:hypothetical protein